MDPVADELAALLRDLPRDEAESRARAACAEGRVRSADARIAAATILESARDLASVRLAHDLALGALGSSPLARSLAARCYDRMRMLAGEPQKFGTQRGPDGAPWPVDPKTTDSERAKWDLPPLAILAAKRDEERN